MVPIGFHLGLRQVVMALMNWAIDVPLELNKVMQYLLSVLPPSFASQSAKQSTGAGGEGEIRWS